MTELTLIPAAGPFTATMSPPGSKSLTNRALVLAALADGVSTLSNVLFADDTLVMLDVLRKLGFELAVDEAARTVRVLGLGGTIPAHAADLFCNNSGTTIRFVAALCALGTGTFTLDGNDRMRQRPIGELVTLLRHAGARVDYLGADGFPPLRIHAHALPGGILKFGAARSSQFLSAILQVAPYARHEVRVQLEQPQTSWPYVEMTMQLMDRFHVTPELFRDPVTRLPMEIIIPQFAYRATDLHIEPDASNASYFLAAAAINPGSKVTIEGLGRGSLQGDVAFADLLHRMGADLIFGRDFMTVTGTNKLDGITADMSGVPDTAQTLAVAALFAKGPTTLKGLHTLRVKETDRLAALQTELRKLGAKAEISGDALTITPRPSLTPGELTPATIDTYDDHRMAMSFAVAGTRSPGVTIRDPECTRKTYPDFFADLERVVRSK